MFNLLYDNGNLIAYGEKVSDFNQLSLNEFLRKYPYFKNSDYLKGFDLKDLCYVVRFNFNELPFIEIGYPSDDWNIFDSES